MWEKLISSVVRGDYYVEEVNIICCKRGLLCGTLTTDDINLSHIIVPSNNR
jgi:hypothetical protein